MRSAVLAASLVSLFLASGCASAPDPLEGSVNLGEPLAPISADSDVPTRFSWIVDGELAGLAHPATGLGLAWNIQYLVDSGVTTLFTLTVTALDPSILASYPVTSVHLPVKDFTAPTIEQLNQFIATTSDALAGGGSTAVHCAAGLGRTGTFSAVYLVHKGMTAAQAIAKVRELRPGSIETSAQEAAINDYAMSLGRSSE
jgi:atypical dual specificity phosphatase